MTGGLIDNEAGSLHLTNVRLPDGSGPVSILIRDGRIVAIGPDEGPTGSSVTGPAERMGRRSMAAAGPSFPASSMPTCTSTRR